MTIKIRKKDTKKGGSDKDRDKHKWYGSTQVSMDHILA